MAQFTPQIQGWILASEGGYVDHPQDPGGATNMGITHRTLAAWRGVPSVTKQQVRDLTRAEALQIYEAQYWRTSGADRMPAGLDYAMFDYAVNSGPARAVKDLQRVLGVGVDGIVGAQTLAAIARRQTVDLITGLCDRRRSFVRGLSTYSTFGRGWERRIGSVEANALSLIGMESPAQPEPSSGQAQPEQPSGVDTILRNPGGLAGLFAGISSVLSAISDNPVLTWLLVAATVAAAGFLLWRFVIARKKADPA